MPVIVNPVEKYETPADQGDGWVIWRIAGRDLFGGIAMAAFHWSLAPHAAGPQFEHGDVDEMFYVITGMGAAVIAGRRLTLEAESLLWLESGDAGHFEAGADGLEVLQAYAPGA